jgi:hypothetical protein
LTGLQATDFRSTSWTFGAGIAQGAAGEAEGTSGSDPATIDNDRQRTELRPNAAGQLVRGQAIQQRERFSGFAYSRFQAG